MRTELTKMQRASLIGAVRACVRSDAAEGHVDDLIDCLATSGLAVAPSPSSVDGGGEGLAKLRATFDEWRAQCERAAANPETQESVRLEEESYVHMLGMVLAEFDALDPSAPSSPSVGDAPPCPERDRDAGLDVEVWFECGSTEALWRFVQAARPEAGLVPPPDGRTRYAASWRALIGGGEEPWAGAMAYGFAQAHSLIADAGEAGSEVYVLAVRVERPDTEWQPAIDARTGLHVSAPPSQAPAGTPPAVGGDDCPTCAICRCGHGASLHVDGDDNDDGCHADGCGCSAFVWAPPTQTVGDAPPAPIESSVEERALERRARLMRLLDSPPPAPSDDGEGSALVEGFFGTDDWHQRRVDCPEPGCPSAPSDGDPELLAKLADAQAPRPCGACAGSTFGPGRVWSLLTSSVVPCWACSDAKEPPSAPSVQGDGEEANDA